MLEILQNLKNVIDAPPEVLLACPVGIIAALHFAGSSPEQIKGARTDSIVKAAKAASLERPSWVKSLGVTLGLSVAGGSFMYLQDPNFWTNLLRYLPL